MVQSTVPTSRRGYLSQSELEEFANYTVTDTTEADDKISQAEEMIDAFVGSQIKHFESDITGRPAASGATSLTLQSNQQNLYDIDYFKLCEIEIIGGTGAGQRRKITGSTLAGVLTVDSAWVNNPDTTSFYKIYQLGKFPREQDVICYTENAPTTYYKQIPEAVKRAVAAQVEFIVEMGDDYFASDRAEKDSESIGDYSYANAAGAAGVFKLIAPKAKLLLRGFRNRTGSIVV
jgi:hypothetical protein